MTVSPPTAKAKAIHPLLNVDDLVGETAILLHPPLPLVGVSTVMERERRQNDSLANG